MPIDRERYLKLDVPLIASKMQLAGVVSIANGYGLRPAEKTA